MAFYFADGFLSCLDQRRIVTITGLPGAGKTAMGHDIARYYLERGYYFSSNLPSPWNDPLTYSREEYLLDSPILQRRIRNGADRDEILASLPEQCPWVWRKVFLLDEAGEDLRAWKYFTDLARFPRKFRNYIIIPSLRIPHEDLAQLIVWPDTMWRTVFPFWDGGLFHWQFDNGFQSPPGGWFFYFPDDVIGVYDTDDLGDTTQYVIQTFEDAVDRRRLDAGQKLVSGVEYSEANEIERDRAANTRKLQAVALALQNARRSK
jgi:hypothetical protein